MSPTPPDPINRYEVILLGGGGVGWRRRVHYKLATANLKVNSPEQIRYLKGGTAFFYFDGLKCNVDPKCSLYFVVAIDIY